MKFKVGDKVRIREDIEVFTWNMRKGWFMWR